MHPLLKVAAATAILVGATAGARADDLTVALIYGRTGPLEAYAKQTEAGLRLGFEYATKGTMTVDGRKITIVVKDDQTKPDVAKSALAEAYEDDHADIAIGTTSSAAAIAMLPVAEEHKKILIVEPAVADQITGDKWNRYIFRTGRNSSQDAIANAVAIGKPGVHIATLAQDYAFGRDGVAAFKEALAKTGATSTTRNTLPPTPPTSPPSASACSTRSRTSRAARSSGFCGPAAAIRWTSCRTSTPAATASNFQPAATSSRRLPPTSASPAWKARPTITTASPRTR